MRKFFTLLFCSLFCSLFAEKMVVDTLKNVDLLTRDIVSETNHNYGEEFYVHNKNDKPILFTIQINEVVNGKNTLIKHPMTIEPNTIISVGAVEQSDRNKEAGWSWEWSVKFL